MRRLNPCILIKNEGRMTFDLVSIKGVAICENINYKFKSIFIKN
ncbi:hypothetical protein NARC_40072 [Candidatus Nitrosocosmicus arcticus]|uniref:Uncharacterized protein n=1 Tax=Candidatus Nitrosocosmicus arcticus TaxID=2035267 RepID=A0A557SWZ6_9ARCH|nr:hypothetical protein NARC_40072 [Candidatus Nitrosocosmicus arcticus]